MDLVSGEAFAGWQALNDTIMGGQSSGSCRVGKFGLDFEGIVIEEGGGFISVRSPLFSPPLDLSRFRGFDLNLAGDGRRFKLAVACADGLAGLTELVPGGLRWVYEFPTAPDGYSDVRISFQQLVPSLRAQPLERLPFAVPLRFDPSRINRLQILHSRFGDDGKANVGFRPGPIHLAIKLISAYV